MRTTALALALLLVAPLAGAAPKHWYSDKKWWAGEAVIGAAVFLDMHSTSQALHNGNTESNFLLGPHPSDGRVAAFGVGAFAYWTTAHAVDWHFFHNELLGFRIFGYTAIPTAALITHLPAAIHNYGLPAPPPPAAVRECIVRPCVIHRVVAP